MNQFSGIATMADRIISHPTWDVVSVFALVAIGFFYGISAGRRRIVSTVLYTYMAYAISLAVPYDQWAGNVLPMNRFFIKAGVFLGLFLLFALLLGSRRARGGFAPASSWWQIFLLSFLQAGLLIHLIIGFFPPDKIKLLAPLTRNIFANPDFHIWWLVVPALLLVILKRLEAREN